METINLAGLVSIKSLYILKKIVSFVDLVKKMNIIKYNKKFQKKFGININNYKVKSGKCIEINKNGFGKEYDIESNKLIYEGNFKNNKWNGYGKEYNKKSKVIFRGEYLNGERNGKGKEYNYYKDQKFELE